MDNRIRPTCQPVEHECVVEIINRKRIVRIAHKGLNIFEIAGPQIIKNRDTVTAVEQLLGQVATDKAGPTRNQNIHRVSNLVS